VRPREDSGSRADQRRHDGPSWPTATHFKEALVRTRLRLETFNLPWLRPRAAMSHRCIRCASPHFRRCSLGPTERKQGAVYFCNNVKGVTESTWTINHKLDLSFIISMTTPNDVLQVAMRQQGQKETPPGSNKSKYGNWYGMDGQPWCAMFVSYSSTKRECPCQSPPRKDLPSAPLA